MRYRIGTLTRTVTKTECPWLPADLPKGFEVYEFVGYTQGGVSRGGVAVSRELDTTPYFELPKNAVEFRDAGA